MKDGFEKGLLEAGALMKKGYLALIDNAGKAIAAITLLVCGLVLFCDISFSDLTSGNFTGTLLVMLISSYLIYFSMSDAGERLGRESEEYLKAKEEFDNILKEIKGEDVSRLREFCKKYSEEELNYRRENFLLVFGYTGADFSEYKDSGRCENKRAKRIFQRAERLRAVALTPKLIFEGEHHGRKSELSSPHSQRLLQRILRLVPTTIGMTVTVSIMLTAKESLDAATVIDGIFKLASLPIIGLRGYLGGYTYVRESKTLWLKTKTRLLEAFLSREAK